MKYDIVYFKDTDVLRVDLSEPASLRGELVDGCRLIHLDADGEIATMEMLNASLGVDPKELPDDVREAVGDFIENNSLRPAATNPLPRSLRRSRAPKVPA